MKKYLLFISICFFIFILMAELNSKESKFIFSHKIHIEEADASCTDCHETTEASENAEDNLLPDEQTCFNCHDENEVSCDLCNSSQDSLNIMYRIQLIKFKFSHKLHVINYQDCLTCHKGIENKIDAAEHITPDPKSICIKCHENVDHFRSPDKCLLCHDQTISLKPLDHSVNWQKEHGIISEINLDQCSHCHQKDYCQRCHEGDNLDHQVHPLNFRTNHGLFAQGNNDNCLSCHQNNTFCQDCHKIQLVKPKNHFLSSWILNGGGKHAREAMADLEKCLSCHDDMNSDLVCIICH